MTRYKPTNTGSGISGSGVGLMTDTKNIGVVIKKFFRFRTTFYVKMPIFVEQFTIRNKYTKKIIQ